MKNNYKNTDDSIFLSINTYDNSIFLINQNWFDKAVKYIKNKRQATVKQIQSAIKEKGVTCSDILAAFIKDDYKVHLSNDDSRSVVYKSNQ